jgi:hypothetical protein
VRLLETLLAEGKLQVPLQVDVDPDPVVRCGGRRRI